MSWIALALLLVLGVGIAAFTSAILLLLEDYIKESARAREFKRREKND